MWASIKRRLYALWTCEHLRQAIAQHNQAVQQLQAALDRRNCLEPQVGGARRRKDDVLPAE